MRLLLAVLLVGLLPAFPAQAGTHCESRPVGPAELAKAAETALAVAGELDRIDAPVAIVARVGTDLSKQGLVYSHAGFAVRDSREGRWTVFHLLNDCGSDRSALHAQGLVNFFADDLVNQHARIVWLKLDAAQRLAAHLDALPANALHQPAYNIIARPGSGNYQNSTAWILETLGATLPSGSRIDTRRQAYDFVRQDGFAADNIHIPYAKRIAGGLFSANAHFTDHSVATRLSGDYPVVTVRSIVRYLDTAGHTSKQSELRHGKWQAMLGPL